MFGILRRISTERRENRGQSLVEMALFLPILLLLLAGLIEVGMYANVYLTVLDASREGARMGADGDPDPMLLQPLTHNETIEENVRVCLEGVDSNYPDEDITDFYFKIACLAYRDLHPLQVPTDTVTLNDVVISLYAVAPLTTGLEIVARPNISDSIIVFDTFGMTSTHMHDGYYAWLNNFDPAEPRYAEHIAEPEMRAYLTENPPSRAIAFLVVELWWEHDLLLNLPVISSFIPDPLLIHSYTLMPLSAAEPTPTPGPSPTPAPVPTSTPGGPPEVFFSTGTFAVNEGAGSVEIPVYLSKPATGYVYVDYRVLDGTAQNGSDFIAASGTLTYPIGTTARSFFIQIIDDIIEEGLEDAVLELYNPSAGLVLGNPDDAVLNITDNDTAPVLSYRVESYTEAEGIGTVNVVVDLSYDPGVPVSVDYSTQDGSAVAPGDYGALNNTLTFPSGTTSLSFPLTIVDDLTAEPSESFQLWLSNPSGGGAVVGGTLPVIFTITDNDSPPVVSFTTGAYSVQEDAGTASVNVSLTFDPGVDVTVDYFTTNGTAVEPDDYSASSGTLTFISGGGLVQPILIPIIDDSVNEAAETLNITLVNPTNATIGGTNPASLTIIDNDALPVLSFGSGTFSALEASGSAIISVTLAPASGQAVSIDYATGAGSATPGVDFTPVNDTLTIDAGDTVGTFLVPLIDDAVDEDNETVNLHLANPLNATIGGFNPATLTIVDDDVVLGDCEFMEVSGQVVVEAEYYVAQQPGLGGFSDIQWLLAGPPYSGGSVGHGALQALPNDGDNAGLTTDGPRLDFDIYIEDAGDYYIFVRGWPGTSSAGTNDSIHAGIDGTPFTLSGYGFSGWNDTSQFEWLRWDSPVALSVGHHTINIWMREDGMVIDRLMMSTDGGAIANYSPAVGPALSPSPSGCSKATQPVVDFSDATYSVVEDGGTATISVTLDAAWMGGTITVDYATSDGTALAGSDYGATNGTLTFDPGDVSESFSVSVFNDGLYEGAETVNLTLSNPTNAVIGTNNPAVLTIVDDEFPMEWGVVSVDSNWTTVSLDNTYTDIVVVCSINYRNNNVPEVVRVRNASGNSFQVRIQNPHASNPDVPLNAEDVHCMIIEAGAYSFADGTKIEAQKYTSTVTDRKGSFVAQTQTYLQAYTNPVVLGQVMTYNDPDWSVFWSRSSSSGAPPSATDLRVGKHVGEDSDRTRADEVVGFIVIEARHGTINGIEYESGLGADIVRGVLDSPPYAYSFDQAFGAAPEVGIAVQEAMDGGDGSWAITYGINPLSATGINLAVDEDQIGDSDRGHTTEQVAYVVFAQATGGFVR